jgi:DNA-binding NtrC family response regulator
MDANQQRRRRVISVGTIPELVVLRHGILELAGYEVFSTMKMPEAASRIREGEFAVLVLCYSVSDVWREQLIKDFREFSPEGRIVGITNHPFTETPRDVDELVYGIDGPEILLNAIQQQKAA